MGGRGAVLLFIPSNLIYPNIMAIYHSRQKNKQQSEGCRLKMRNSPIKGGGWVRPHAETRLTSYWSKGKIYWHQSEAKDRGW